MQTLDFSAVLSPRTCEMLLKAQHPSLAKCSALQDVLHAKYLQSWLYWQSTENQPKKLKQKATTATLKRKIISSIKPELPRKNLISTYPLM